MGVSLKTSLKAVDGFFEKSRVIIAYYIRMALAKLGEECIAKIRDRSAAESWIDHTGNLRSSIGYAVYEHGAEQIASAFATVGGGSEGSAEGRRMVQELASEYGNTYALVVIAGMRYASYVEAIEGKDVLASTELWARGVVDARLGRAMQQAVKRINKLEF
ncbi:MAG: HK97 gp10 family phage protein [Prevotella sp.]|nr:HK97 gp10 family phage protein [Prevotella sp.]